MNRKHPTQAAFTLIEIMVVCAIMGIILGVGVPTLYRMMQKTGMRKAVDDIIQVCQNARARAILSGSESTVVFRPYDRQFSVGGGGSAAPGGLGRAVTSGQLPEDIVVEGLGINWLDCTEYESAVVRFFPDGRCDEMILVLRSDKGDWRKITLEVTTGLASWTEDIR